MAASILCDEDINNEMCTFSKDYIRYQKYLATVDDIKFCFF